MDAPMILPQNLNRWRITFKKTVPGANHYAFNTVDVLAKNQVDAEILGSSHLSKKYSGLWVLHCHHGQGAAPEVVYEAPEQMDGLVINNVWLDECADEVEDEPLRDVVECEICGADILDSPATIGKHVGWHKAQSSMIHALAGPRWPYL